MVRPASAQLPNVTQIAGKTVSASEALVELWDRAEDWTTPRIPPAQLKVLNLLRRRGPLKLSALASAFGAIPSSTSRLCDRLEATGLIRREVPSTNRREVWVSVTLEGARRLDEFDRVRREDFTAVLELMEPAKRDCLLEGLTSFSIAAGELQEDDSLGA